MLTFLHRLIKGRPPAEARVALTPGSLYAKMSAEFRARREGLACACTMPLPYTCEPAMPGEPNWRLQQMWTECRHCQAIARSIEARYSARFNVRDPFRIVPGSIFDGEAQASRPLRCG